MSAISRDINKEDESDMAAHFWMNRLPVMYNET